MTAATAAKIETGQAFKYELYRKNAAGTRALHTLT